MRSALTHPRVCLVTSGQPSTNPRLVKEADALSDAGYEVCVVYARFATWAVQADRQLDGRPWTMKAVQFGEVAPRPLRLALSLRRRVADTLHDVFPSSTAVAVRALHYIVPELGRLAASQPADLYIAHNLAALPAAAYAARVHGARLGFDAEDFHRGELTDSAENERARRIPQFIEDQFIPTCDYVTAASDGIAEAYAAALGIERPPTILNVFPLAEREVEVSSDELAAEKPVGTRSLHWFSQTIGPGRGLEDAVRALPRLPDDIVLTLRGSWAPGYERVLRDEAEALGVNDRIHGLALCPPREVVRRAAEHDVGLALEPGRDANNELATSNKLFTYLLAGLPFVASDTAGQRPVCQDLPEATRLYTSGSVDAFADAVRSLLASPDARQAATTAGTSRYNWDHEQAHFLDIVAHTLGA